jgi:hypothetical protein
MTASLVQVDDGIWIAEGENVDFYGFPYPTRCVIVRLPGGGLWVWSPIQLNDDLRLAVEALGPPEHLVSPNKLHHLFLSDWQDVWPGAILWGPASSIRKRRDLAFQSPLDTDVPETWQGAFDMVRFSGSVFMDEMVFFHRSSRTVILADLSENFSEEFLAANWGGFKSRIARLWKITEGFGFAPLEWRLSFLNRRKARAARAKILDWPARRVIMAHGEWQREDGQAFLKKALAWV